MPTTSRERVLAAFHAAIAGVAELATVARNPDWAANPPASDALPAAAVYDGAERAEAIDVQDQRITGSVAVELRTLQGDTATALSDLNARLGLIQAALGRDPGLGGLLTGLRYLGCDEPDIVELGASPCEATLLAHFELERLQPYHNPYA